MRSKSALLYDEVRQALQSGRYIPGERIDPTTLAREFHISPTPVRIALSRLVGEGMIEDHAREGLHVPLATEATLRDHYDWMQRLLLMACDIGFEQAEQTPEQSGPPIADPESDIVTPTRRLFEAIALGTGHVSLHRAVRQTNDKLGPIRMAKRGLFKNAVEELAGIHQAWIKRDVSALRSAVVDYHERRVRLVPGIIGIVNKVPTWAQ
ncbi:transcriptional regulator [Xanthomonas hortorum pv. hederae]|nr:transcriptional regulator [Xanthomonas hortorum pv. hederae]PUF01423.1 GntR family transcriptional regulator [Xanthomonas hortorum pv. hederae]